MATFQTPRIVVEQSPWQTFFEELPGMFATYQKTKLHAEQMEKNRQYETAKMYAQDMLNKENIIIDNIFEAEADATKYNINIKEPMSRLHSQFISNGGLELESITANQKEKRYSDLWDILGEIRQAKGQFNEGVRVSKAVDIDKDALVSLDEIDRYQNLMREVDPNYVISEPLVQGARYGLTDPASRLQELELEKGEQEVKLAKARIKEIESKVGKEVADAYKASGVLATGIPSYQDLAVGEAVKAEWQYMEPNILHQMVSNTLVTYDDPVSDQIDKEDIQYAIVPYIKKYAEDKIANPDYREAVGLTDQDVEAKNEKYLKVINSITSNALSGVRLNEGYTLKSQKDILESRTMNRAALKQMFDTTELATYNKAVETLANILPIVADTGEPSEAHIATIQDNLKAAGINWDKTKIYTEYVRLRGSADPYTVAITIQQNPDSQTLLKALGQESFVAIMQQATAALQTTSGAPVRRTAKKKVPPAIPPGSSATPSGFDPAYPYESGPASSLGQANLDARIRDAALLSLDIRDAKAEGNFGNHEKVRALTAELELVEKQIQQLLDEGFQPGTSSLQDITLELPTR